MSLETSDTEDGYYRTDSLLDVLITYTVNTCTILDPLMLVIRILTSCCYSRTHKVSQVLAWIASVFLTLHISVANALTLIFVCGITVLRGTSGSIHITLTILQIIVSPQNLTYAGISIAAVRSTSTSIKIQHVCFKAEHRSTYR